MENDLNRTEILLPEWNSPILGLFLCCLVFVTVFGNVLVIVAVFKERTLKSVANYYIISLAFADLCVGLFVMPISALNKVTNNYWFFGDVLCDVWHSIDICASTASINSLLIIALDRYSAISDPISYHNSRLTRHWLFFVLLIWIGSAFISFPAIAYWRWLTPIYPPNQCDFPNDLYYLVFSSLVSFYIPLPIMIFVYVRMYRAATTQMIALKTGHKLNCKTADGKPLILRIHRGGTQNANTKIANQKPYVAPVAYQKSSKSLELSKSLECLLINNLSSMGPFTSSFSSLIQASKPLPLARSFSLQNIDQKRLHNFDISKENGKMDRSLFKTMGSFEQKNSQQTKNFLDIYFNGCSKKLLRFYNQHYYGHSKLMSDIRLNSINNNEKSKKVCNKRTNVRLILSSLRTRYKRNNSNISNTSNFYCNYTENEIKLSNSIATKVKGISLTKKLKKFTKEQKAAKTLGIVMGVFILCWLPFFIYNVITGIFQANLSDSHDTIFFVFTWFGYLNSGCNPIIYAFSSRDFRRAFYKILFPASFLKDKKRKNFLFSMQSSSLSTRDSKHHLASSRLNNSVYKLKNFDNVKPSCSLCKDFELVLAKNKSVKSPWYSFKSSTIDAEYLKLRERNAKSNDFSVGFRTKISNFFSIKNPPPTNRTASLFEPKVFNVQKKSSSKHSTSVSSNCKKKTGQIPIGTRYRFKTFKQPVQIGLDFCNQSDISDKIGFSYECNEDDEYLNQIHSSVMKKKLETCNSSKF